MKLHRSGRGRVVELVRRNGKLGKARHSLEAFEAMEQFEARTLMAAVFWDGGAGTANWQDAANWNRGGVDALPQNGDDVTISVAANPTIAYGTGGVTLNSLTCDEALSINGGTLTLTGAADINAPLTMNGGAISGGSWDVTGGALRGTNAGGTITDAQITGDVLLDTTSASVRIAGTTRFGAARLTAGSVTLQFSTGYTLQDLVVAEGAATGGRTIQGAVGGTGTLTIAPSGVIRLAAGCGGGLAIGNSSQATLVNNGLISAEAAGRTLSFNNTTVTNNTTIQASAGTLDLSPTNWTNPGSITAANATLSLAGIWSGTGSITEANSTINLGGTFSIPGLTLNRTGGTINLTGTASNAANTLTFNATTGSWNLLSGSITGGTLAFPGSDRLVMTNSGGTLTDVQVNGDILLDTTSASVRIAGTTRFNAARLTAGSATLQLNTGYTLQDLVVAEGAATGTRTIQGAVGGTGTLTIAPSAVVRLAAGAGGGLTISNSSQATLVNNGLISAEAAGRTLAFNNTTVTNNNTIQVSAGTLDLSPSNWTNPGSITGANSTLNLAGTWSGTGSISENNCTVTLGGTFAIPGLTLNRTGGTINLTGTASNAANTFTFNATTGSWNFQGGSITGGTLAFPGSEHLVMTNLGGTLTDVQVNGDILLDTTSASVRIVGTTRFNAARLTAASVSLQFNAGYTLQDLIVAEGAAAGGRSVQGAVGGTGTFTIAPSGVIRLAAGAGGGLTISNSSQMTLVNNGLVTAEAAGRTLSFNSTTVTNNNTIQVSAGTLDLSPTNWTNAGSITGSNATMNLAGSWSSVGTITENNCTVTLAGTFAMSGFTLTRTGGTVNLTGAATNAASTFTFTAATGSWNFLGGSITGGTLAFPGSDRLVMTSNGGTLTDVQVNGDLLLDTTSASVRIAGTTRFNTARLTAASVSLLFNPGYSIQDLVVAEGAALGGRSIQGAVGGTGTLTIAPSGVVRLAAGCGGNLTITNSSVMTLVNNGLISAEAAGRTLSFNNTTVTNSGTIQATAGTLDFSPTNWANPGSLVATDAILSLGGAWSSTGTITATNCTVNLGGTLSATGFTLNRTGGTVNLTGVMNNVGNTFTFTPATGSWNLLAGRINGGTIAFPGSDRLTITPNGGTLADVLVNGDLLLDSTSASLLITGATRFSAARLRSNGNTLQFTPGYTLFDLVVAEGAALGGRSVQGAVGGAGSLTIAPSGEIRLAAGAGGGLSVSMTSVLTLVNNGTIDAEAAGRTLDINVSTIANYSAGTLTGGAWTASGTSAITLPAGIVITTNNATIGVGAAASFPAATTLSTNNGTLATGGGGTYTITPAGGTLVNTGTIRLAPTNTLAVVGNFTQAAGGTLNVQIQGPAAGDIGRLSVTGAATLAGTANVDAVNGFVPDCVNRVFLTAGSMAGQFTSQHLPTPPLGHQSLLVYLGGEVRFAISPLSDFNRDGILNSQDVFDFLVSFFNAGPSADFNHDGSVNSQDFFDFIANFFEGCP